MDALSSSQSLPELNGLRRAGLAAAAIGVVLTALGAFIDPDQFFRSYLVAFQYWLGLGLGCLGILMVYHLTGGSWGVAVRRVLEAGTATLPVMAVLFLPLAFGLHHLYEWTHTETVMADPVLSKKVAYLNIPFFLVRAAIYFIVWNVIAHLLYWWSGRQDRTGDPALIVRMRKLSGAGIVLFGLAVTFAAFDWLMSLEPHWFSTIFGMVVLAGQGLNALAFVVVMAYLLSGRELFGRVLVPTVLNDLGNLVLAFVMVWAYLSFSQLLIIWSGNLPEEIPWYLHRIGGGWKFVAMALAVFHFAVPFLILLGRGNKRQLPRLAALAAGLLFIRMVDIFFLVAPTFSEHFTLHWLDLAAMVGVGGIWLTAFLWRLPQRPLLAPNDPELEPALAREH
jgi:hypothetical protein